MQQSESLFRPYAESFVINKSCGMQSKVLDRSVRTAPTIKFLSRFSFHSSTILISTCRVLYDFLYAAKKSEKSSAILETKTLLANFSSVFEKVFKILTDWQFELQCLSSVFLSRGLTQATFVLLGKMLHLKLLLFAIDSGVLKKLGNHFDYSWRSFILTDSFPWVQFLETLFNFVTIYRRKGCVIINTFICGNSTPNFSNARMVFNIISTACLSLSKIYFSIILM